MKYKFCQNNIRTLLAEYPELKDKGKRMEAVWTYYEVFEGITDTISKEEWFLLTSPATILRNIRKIVEQESREKRQNSFGI